MSDVTILCQRYEIQKGGTTYPFYLGALDAKELNSVSFAPSFSKNTPHSDIANEVLNPPTKHWQRPLIEAKVEKIAERFDRDDEIMPNPVLLAVAPGAQISVDRERNAAGAETGLWRIVVSSLGREAAKPLWIIDGQHRIAGLAASKLTSSPVPFVLLHSDQLVYVPTTLAKIFAEVTTQATPLNSIHQAWMQYVFELTPFEQGSPDWRAMKATALLCETQLVESNPNPFYGRIGFNPDLGGLGVVPNGFAYDAKSLQELLRDKYFQEMGGQHRLSELEIAEQLSLAVSALKTVVKGNVDQSAFFGVERFEQKYFRDGFIAGVCAHLLAHGKPADWVSVLEKMNFSRTDWNVDPWVISTGGAAGTASKRIAFAAFEHIFREGELPENVDSLVNYFLGEDAELEIEFRTIAEDGQVIKKQSEIRRLPLSGSIDYLKCDAPAGVRWVKISTPSKNVGKVTIALEVRPYDDEYSQTSFRKGKKFEDAELSQLKNKVVLSLKAELYGGRQTIKKLTIQFND